MESAGIQAKLFLPDSSLVSAGKLPASGSGDGGLWGRVTRPGVRPAPEMGASLPDWYRKVLLRGWGEGRLAGPLGS